MTTAIAAPEFDLQTIAEMAEKLTLAVLADAPTPGDEYSLIAQTAHRHRLGEAAKHPIEQEKNEKIERLHQKIWDQVEGRLAIEIKKQMDDKIFAMDARQIAKGFGNEPEKWDFEKSRAIKKALMEICEQDCEFKYGEAATLLTAIDQARIPWDDLKKTKNDLRRSIKEIVEMPADLFDVVVANQAAGQLLQYLGNLAGAKLLKMEGVAEFVTDIEKELSTAIDRIGARNGSVPRIQAQKLHRMVEYAKLDEQVRNGRNWEEWMQLKAQNPHVEKERK